MILIPHTDAVELFDAGRILYSEEDPPRRFELERVRSHKAGLIVQIAGIGDRNGAETLRGIGLTIDRDERPPTGPDEFWVDELAGLEVRSTDGEVLGTVAGVFTGGAQHRLVVATPTGEVEAPFVAEIVIRVAPDEGFVVMDPPAGLFPEH